MGSIASQITSLTIVYSIVYSDADQSKHQSSASPAFVRGIHRGPVNSPHKWPVARKMFPFDDVIMPLSEPMLTRCQLDPEEHILINCHLKFKTCYSWKCIYRCVLQNVGHFLPQFVKCVRLRKQPYSLSSEKFEKKACFKFRNKEYV